MSHSDDDNDESTTDEVAFLEVWAKSPTEDNPTAGGEPLTVHSRVALRAAMAVEDRVGIVPGVPGWFWRAVLLAALLHDFGKIDPGFQRQIRHPGSRTHAWRQRHEVLSLGAVGLLLPAEPAQLRWWVAAAVATHHRPLLHPKEPGREILAPHLPGDGEPLRSRFTVADDPAVLRGLLAWFARQAHDHALLTGTPDLTRTTTADVLDAVAALLAELNTHWGLDHHGHPVRTSDGLPLVLLQGAVTLADHLASAHGELLTDHPVSGFTHDFLARLSPAGHVPGACTEEVLAEHQKQARAARRPHLLLRAPTGSGKTEAGLMWSENAIEELSLQCGGRPRVFYVLPYLASINAMADRLARVCRGEVGVVHSKAGVYHLQHLGEDTDQAPARALEAVEASRLHRELLRVTTPYQLLRAAFAGVTDAATLVDTTNSVFLFDELHAYEPRRLGMILAMVRLWAQHLGGRIGVLSATLPDRFTSLLDDTLGQNTLEPVDGFATSTLPPRHLLRLGRDHLTAPETVDRIAADLQAGQAVLVIANNVADAITLYEQLRNFAPERGDCERAAWLLHARFEHRDRARIEHDITTWFATAGTTCRPGLLVATQAAEVSLDVDLTVLHTSGAPLEPLLQRFGRINRRGLRPPESVWVYPPEYRTSRGNQIRADGVYDAEPTMQTWELLQQHHPHTPLEEADTQAWLNKLYTSTWGDNWEKKVCAFRDAFTRDFLIFDQPFTDRTHLKKKFFEQFDGFEAILHDRVNDYQIALRTSAKKAEGRLLASRYHIPLPDHCRRHAEFRKDLGIHVIDGLYDPTTGLTEILGTTDYQPGEIL
ncbi:CRISPR-associated helicase/endonuclease Cas3 [Saccharopolyspora subtropica]|uniref:CRISPR-associated helicase/endonuclease Cas3 n=1 Tax=Saccharopolyspora thermophila TaxID=89367 RepID=A0A917K0S7_9PSEU|nr:CRISPR-associated helicase Cas3' [Saccharopolyspora subtropica]GGI95164.1 CRISPR-associated helicase/endonuclease Cas3 [Saccharopolyspora subtropica]